VSGSTAGWMPGSTAIVSMRWLPRTSPTTPWIPGCNPAPPCDGRWRQRGRHRVAVVAPGSYSVARPAERTARGRDRIADLVLRPALALAAARQREHQRPAAPVRPQAHQPVRAQRTRPECRRCRTQLAAPHRARRPDPRTGHEVIDAALPCAPHEFTSPKGALAEQVEPSRLVPLAYPIA
jgi:hypothetical protein